MRHPFNYLSLLSLPALAALIYFPTGDADFLGFLGFLVFLRYLWVNPDELFLLTLRRAATSAFLAECVLLAPLLLLFYLLEPGSSPMPQALGLSFALSLIFFCLVPHLAGVEGKQGLRMSLHTKIRELRLRDRLSQESWPSGWACGGRPRPPGKWTLQPLPEAGHGHRPCLWVHCGGYLLL